MTISKEKFEQLALEVWNSQASMCDTREGNQIITDFAHALIKRVEESKVAGYSATSPAYWCNLKLIALPLVSVD